MSWVTKSSKRHKASRDYVSEGEDNLVFYDVLTQEQSTKEWKLNPEGVAEYGITPEDAEYILNFAKAGFKIPKGTEYLNIIGTYDKLPMVVKYDIRLNDIITKYELYEG